MSFEMVLRADDHVCMSCSNTRYFSWLILRSDVLPASRNWNSQLGNFIWQHVQFTQCYININLYGRLDPPDPNPHEPFCGWWPLWLHHHSLHIVILSYKHSICHVLAIYICAIVYFYVNGIKDLFIVTLVWVITFQCSHPALLATRSQIMVS